MLSSKLPSCASLSTCARAGGSCFCLSAWQAETQSCVPPRSFQALGAWNDWRDEPHEVLVDWKRGFWNHGVCMYINIYTRIYWLEICNLNGDSYKFTGCFLNSDPHNGMWSSHIAPFKLRLDHTLRSEAGGILGIARDQKWSVGTMSITGIFGWIWVIHTLSPYLDRKSVV